MFQKLLNNNEQSVKWFKVCRVSKYNILMMRLKVLLKCKVDFSIRKSYGDFQRLPLSQMYKLKSFGWNINIQQLGTHISDNQSVLK